ncbi:MAG: GNAT family N-acetyltransferase [Chloroflexota bacterium]
MADKITIRAVTMEDAEQLQKNCFSAMRLEQVQKALRNTLVASAEGKEYQVVAEVNDEVVGCATLIRDTHPLRSHRAGLFGIVVHPHHQKKGIARQLVDSLSEQAQAVGIKILETSARADTGADLVYPRLGFTEYGRLPRGLLQPDGEKQVFDEVYFYRALC